MKKKNGLIAVSLIYSFFLVFLMIMLSSSVKNAETRQMLQSIKEDIKKTLNYYYIFTKQKPYNSS